MKDKPTADSGSKSRVNTKVRWITCIIYNHECIYDPELVVFLERWGKEAYWSIIWPIIDVVKVLQKIFVSLSQWDDIRP